MFHRAIADQSSGRFDFVQLRHIAAKEIRSNADEYAPFIGFEPSSSEFESYCERVESSTMAEWGGQVEIKAIANHLKLQIIIFDPESGPLIMGEDGKDHDVIRLTYHRHYYALGEHYNSVETIS